MPEGLGTVLKVAINRPVQSSADHCAISLRRSSGSYHIIRCMRAQSAGGRGGGEVEAHREDGQHGERGLGGGLHAAAAVDHAAPEPLRRLHEHQLIV